MAVVPSYGDVDLELIDWHSSRGVLGHRHRGRRARGNVNGALVPGIEHARHLDVPVVVTSRCITGVVAPIYGGPGRRPLHRRARRHRRRRPEAGRPASRSAVGLALAPDVALRDWFASVLG